MALLSDRYAAQIAGVLSCYDRLIIMGTLPGVCYAEGMAAYLRAHDIRLFDYARFVEPLREEIRQLVVARNHRRVRAGKPPLDVEAEIEREIAALGGL